MLVTLDRAWRAKKRTMKLWEETAARLVFNLGPRVPDLDPCMKQALIAFNGACGHLIFDPTKARIAAGFVSWQTDRLHIVGLRLQPYTQILTAQIDACCCQT
jgi:hypothetical protein